MFNAVRRYLPGKLGNPAPVLPVVRLQGAIGMATPLRPGLSLSSVANNLDKAFAFKKAPAVALIVNSPGGSPVQSRLIYQRIRALAEEHEKQVLVFVEDVAASGGYMIALAGDEIIADPSSVVGSIGVVSAGFGFVDLLDKIGVERRVHTSGTRKAILDPFRPEVEGDVAHLKALQHEIHEVFIDMVRTRRGERLREDDELFSGLFWAGEAGRDRGLVDAIGDLRSTAREKFGKDVKLRLIGGERSFFPRKAGVGLEALMGGRDGLSADIISALEARALWARFGL
ncbi:S49 family peptidase [Breoghania sp. L-A4]|uniref:S49 family peptidase n=1 Tax=Breoghania sp. L-A4 TaxID=2304600 RepID=UPI000E360BCC|nr:S49 family peptidase [Breoghania sp. L-A4]AXS42453.1 S49 family peptidase [Breoghania sp. L-A4]